jgi:hypothetical protein
MFGFELALADGNPALADKTRIAGNELDLVLVEIARVNAVETLDIGLAVIDEFGPVVLGHAGGEAIVRRIARVLGEFRRMPHNLLRHTAHVYAGTAEPAALDQRHFLAITGRPARGRHAAAATADYDQIEMFPHNRSLTI